MRWTSSVWWLRNLHDGLGQPLSRAHATSEASVQVVLQVTRTRTRRQVGVDTIFVGHRTLNSVATASQPCQAKKERLHRQDSGAKPQLTTTLLVHIPVRVTGTRVDIVETRPVQKAVREILSWVKSPLFCFVAWSLVDIPSIGDQLLNLFPHSHADDITITSAACLCY